jgi:hypothetical protein
MRTRSFPGTSALSEVKVAPGYGNIGTFLCQGISYIGQGQVREGLCIRTVQNSCSLFLEPQRIIRYLLRFASCEGVKGTGEDIDALPLLALMAAEWHQYHADQEYGCADEHEHVRLQLALLDASIRTEALRRTFTRLTCLESGPLLFCASFGLVAATRALLQRGADENEIGSHGSALHIASRRGFLRTVEVLVKNGASISLPCRSDRCSLLPISEAASARHLGIVKSPCRAGSEPW